MESKLFIVTFCCHDDGSEPQRLRIYEFEGTFKDLLLTVKKLYDEAIEEISKTSLPPDLIEINVGSFSSYEILEINELFSEKAEELELEEEIVEFYEMLDRIMRKNILVKFGIFFRFPTLAYDEEGQYLKIYRYCEKKFKFVLKDSTLELYLPDSDYAIEINLKDLDLPVEDAVKSICRVFEKKEKEVT